MEKNILSHFIVTNVYSSTTMYTEENTRIKKNNRHGWAFVLKFEGETVYTQNGREYTSDINNVLILPKGCSYEWRCTKAGHFTIVEFDSDVTCENIFCFPVKNGEKYLTRFQRIEYIMALKETGYKLEAMKEVYSTLQSLVQSRNSYLPSDKSAKITPALEYIAKNYAKSITNEELASLTGMSCVYFRKTFTEVMGESPIAYAHSLRIKKAREMLKSDYSTISNIAYSLGYSNIYEFSRDFKKHTGKPPSKY